jgi:hypothetical protein
MVSDMQRLTKAQALLQTVSGRPGVNEDEVTQRIIDAINVPNPEKILPPMEERPPSGPPPELLLEMEKLALEQRKFQLEALKAMASLEEMAAKITKLQADSVKAIADAESAEVGQQIQIYLAQVKELGAIAQSNIKALSQAQIAEMKQVGAGRQGENGSGRTEQGRGQPVASGLSNPGGAVPGAGGSAGGPPGLI